MDAREKGIVAIPCHPGTKCPAVKWKEWQSTMPPIELQREWFRKRCNIAILTTGMVVFDCDDPTKADLVIEKCGETSHKLKTPGGLHLGYRRRLGVLLGNQVRVKGMGLDIRTDRGLAMIPESETEKGRYEWLGPGLLPISKLPVANIGWTRQRTRHRTVQVLRNDDADLAVRRARGYLTRVEGAVSGQGGHGRAMRAAGILVQKFGLTIEQALPLFLEWNLKCDPPWEEKDLLRKLREAERLKCAWHPRQDLNLA